MSDSKAPLGVWGEAKKKENLMQRTNQPNMFYGAKPELFARAKYLRENMTESEQLLWHKLRNNQLKYRFKAQHPIDIFIADFYCHQKQLVIEIDGKIHEQRKYETYLRTVKSKE